MRIKSIFTTDKAKEMNGIWHDIGPEENGKTPKLLIARENNDNFVKLIRRLMNPYKTRAQRKNLGVKKAEEIMCKALSETILLDWKNLEEEDGSKIVYSIEKAYELLSTMNDFKALVISLSEDMDAYRLSVINEVTDEIKK